MKTAEDQDYQYYRLGFKYYKKINPNFIYKRKKSASGRRETTYVLKPADELAAALNEIIQSIQISEYYFSKVILEYPKSIWQSDAKAKVKLLQKLAKCYENIDPNERKIVDCARFVKEMGINF